MSKRGVQQGDPLGMRLFCLSIANALENCCSKHNERQIIAYADDLFIIGEKANIDTCIPDIGNELGNSGLEQNSSKSIIWPPLSKRGINLLREPRFI